MSKINKKIIIILHNKKLLQIDKYKMELDKFKKMNIDLEIHELINIINKNYAKSFLNEMKSNDEKKFNDFKKWRDYIYKIEEKYERKNILIFNGVKITNLMSFKINHFIKKYKNLKVLDFSQLDMPDANTEGFSYSQYLFALYHFITNPKKIYIKLRYVFFNSLVKYLNIHPTYFMVFGKEGENRFKIKKTTNTKVILANSFEYNMELSTKNLESQEKIKGKYAIFLESPVPIFEGDTRITGIKKTDKITVEKWTKSLNDFFSFIEKNFFLKVYICPHPKVKHYSENPNYYFGRKILKDPLCVVSRKAALIITRSSTGVAFGIFNSIPSMIITSNEIISKRKNHYIWQKKFAKSLGRDLVNIDEFDREKISDEIFNLDKNCYKKYMSDYLTARTDGVLNSKILSELI